MTNREKELLSVASEVMDALRSNGLECALSGSLMLAVAGINKRRESNDIDILVDSNLLYNQFQASECGDFRAYVISLVEPKCGKVIAISHKLYPIVSFIHKGFKVDLIDSIEEYTVINGTVLGSLFYLVYAKYSYSLDDSNPETKRKHSEDVQYILENNALGFSKIDLINRRSVSIETKIVVEELDYCPF